MLNYQRVTCPNIPSLLNWSFDSSDSDWSDWSAAEFSAPTTDSIQHLAGQNSQKSVNLWDLNMFMLRYVDVSRCIKPHFFWRILSRAFPSPIGMCWWWSPLVGGAPASPTVSTTVGHCDIACINSIEITIDLPETIGLLEFSQLHQLLGGSLCRPSRASKT